ncbi:MAG: alpha/beta hydrolase [Gammaproteobacteria bacterium]
MKAALFVIGIVVVVYALCCAFLFFMQERMLFHPHQVSEHNRRQLQQYAVAFSAPDGAVLRGWMQPGKNVNDDNTAEKTACDLIIYFGGSAEEVSASILSGNPAPQIDRLYVNYRGYGDSGGKPSAAAMRGDALLIAKEAMAKWHIAPARLCLVGRSLGSHMAAFAAAHYPVAKLIMITPFDSVTNLAAARYPIFPVRRMLRHPFDTTKIAHQIRARTLFILAQTDSTVPPENSAALIKLWQAPHETITLKNTTHARLHTPRYWQTISAFLTTPQQPPENNGIK